MPRQRICIKEEKKQKKRKAKKKQLSSQQILVVEDASEIPSEEQFLPQALCRI